MANHAALQERRQAADLVVEGLAEAPAVVEVQRERVVAEELERLVVMAVHVAREEVEHRHVHQVEEPAALRERRQLPHDVAVVRVCGEHDFFFFFQSQFFVRNRKFILEQTESLSDSGSRKG